MIFIVKWYSDVFLPDFCGNNIRRVVFSLSISVKLENEVSQSFIQYEIVAVVERTCLRSLGVLSTVFDS